MARYRKKSKEIWYETTQDRKKRKKRYPWAFGKNNDFFINLDGNVTWAIILAAFFILLILLWEWLA